MASTSLSVVFRVRGPKVDPDWLTEQTGIQPHYSFRVGEARGASSVLAGWDWRSADGADDDPMIEALLRDLGQHVETLRGCRDGGAELSLSVVGEVRGDVVETPDEAALRRFSVEEGRPFEPFFDVDRVGVFLSEQAIQFLASVGASYQTHIDVEFERFQPDADQPGRDRLGGSYPPGSQTGGH